MSISRVQLAGNHGGGGGADTQIIVTVSATTLGNLIVAFIDAINGGASTLGISDNKGNSYTNVLNTNNFWNGLHNAQAGLWYAIDAFGGVTSITMTNTVGADDVGFVGEYSSTNGWPAVALDKTAGPTTAGSPGTSWASASTATTSQGSEVLWGVVSFDAAPGTITPAAGWATGLSEVISRTDFTDDQVVTSTGAYSFSGTNVNSVSWTVYIVTFKDNAASSVPGWPDPQWSSSTVGPSYAI